MTPRKKAEAEVTEKVVTVIPESAVQAIIPAPQVPSAVLAQPGQPLSPEMSLDLAERRIKQFKGIVKLIASETDPRDLFVFASYKTKTEDDLLKLKAYMPLRVCQNILAWAGALWMPDKEMIERRDEDELGHFIEYDQWVDVLTADGREVRVMGSCSTRHPFHGVAFTFYGCPSCRQAMPYGTLCDQHGRVKARKLNAYRPLSDINRGNVRKHAITNSFNKAVDALGFTPTLRDLKDSGMDITKIPRANFGGNRDEDDSPEPQSKPATQSSQPKQPPNPTQPSQAASNASPAPQAPPSAATGLPKAVIPPQNWGRVEAFKQLKTASGSPYGIVSMNKVDFFVFDNKTLEVGGTRPYTVFELLDLAARSHWDCTFTVEAYKAKSSGKEGWRIVGASKIGQYEWLEDGTPIIQRDPPVQTAMPYEAKDEDIPF
jgi:hypothetical protein